MSATKLGRFHAPEPASAFPRFHFHRERIELQTVDHEPKVAVLDQEDLHGQGIVCSQFIPGAGDPDALGSCTANTVMEALSNILSPDAFGTAVAELGAQSAPADALSDTTAVERAAIGFYHECTDLTGQSGTEWPPTDCGSSGPYIEQMAQHLGLISTAKLAHGAENIVSLMQADGLLLGMPWFNAMFEPNAAGFIDGDGSTTAIQAAINSGVAGGHEIYLSAIESISVSVLGTVDPFRTVLRFRNHWTASWGENGSARMHLSTLVALGSSTDLRQFVAE